MNYLNDISISYIIMYYRIYIIKEYINDSFKKNSNKYIYYNLTLDRTTKKKDIILYSIFNDYNCEDYMISLFIIKDKKTNSY